MTQAIYNFNLNCFIVYERHKSLIVLDGVAATLHCSSCQQRIMHLTMPNRPVQIVLENVFMN